MKIAIEFNEQTNTFTVQFNRGLTLTATDGYPPPPPYDYQIQQMANSLVTNYPSILQKFGDSKEISGLQLTIDTPLKK